MKKNTLIILFFLFSLTISTFGNNFIIKLASYSNKESLTEQISLLDDSIKKNITLIEEDKLYKLFSNTIQSKTEALQLLPIYQKIFTDAYVMVDIYKKEQKSSIDIYLALQEESNNSKKESIHFEPIQTLLQPTKTIEPRLSFQNIIQNQTFYLCPQNIHSNSEKILIEATFGTDTVSYRTLMGKVPSMQMKYTFRKNRLYLITNNRISISQFNTIDKIFFEYMIVGRWFKGKRIHQMRYYKKEADARSYIESITLN